MKNVTIDWFKERIGKRVYRKANTCNCGICEHVTNNGLIIADEQHAWYLDAMAEGEKVYFDEPVKTEDK